MPDPAGRDAAVEATTAPDQTVERWPAVSATVLASAAAAVREAERELDARRFPIPLPSRVAWATALGSARDRTMVARGAGGECLALASVSITRTRALPWHLVARVESFGEPYATAAGAALLRCLTAWSRRHPMILRAVVELECRDEAARTTLRAMLHEAGFVRSRAERVSERTLAIDLAPSEDQIFASFGRSTRQNIRSAAKHGLEVAPIDDARYGARMNLLLEESLARTGAPAQVMDWGAIVQLCRQLPHRSRVVGVFRGSAREPADLVGFAWGLHHGERVEYHTGASARIPGVRLPILYPAIWDLVSWAKRSAGEWFDMGGVTAGTLGSSDALGGISDFKRGFTKDEIALGEEWEYAPHRWRARIAGWTSQLAGTVRRRLHAKRLARAAAAAAPAPEAAPGTAPSREALGDGEGR